MNKKSKYWYYNLIFINNPVHFNIHLNRENSKSCPSQSKWLNINNLNYWSVVRSNSGLVKSDKTVPNILLTLVL